MKYFFFDIDGTLSYWDKEHGEGNTIIPESTKYAIKKLKEKGYFLAIATGRSYSMAEPFLDELGFNNMVCDGGNGIVLDHKLVEVEPLNKEDCIGLINECKQKGYPWAFSPEITAERLTPDNRFYDFTRNEYVKNVVVDGLNPNDYHQIYKVYVACYAPDEQKLEYINKLPWCRYHNNYIFFEPTNKAHGIKKIVDHFGGNYEDVVVFGDEKNDISMFNDPWLKIAMGNGCDELKNLADYVTTSILDDGILNACKHFGWID